MPHYLEIRVFQQMDDVFFVAREIVVEAYHFMPLFEQVFTQMGSQESGAACYEYLFFHVIEVIGPCFQQ
jgi:hypothetical protein